MRAAQPARHDFFAASSQASADRELHRKLENASSQHMARLAEARAEFPSYDAEGEVARRIKQDAIGRLDELLAELTGRLRQNGCEVFFADNAERARDYILGVAKSCGAKRAVKGKSMTTEEVGLNAALEKIGVEVTETDLGEYIVQLGGERPSHILTPAIHLSRQDIGALFARKLGIPYTDEPERLAAAVRQRLRPIFLGAELGVTGVNFAIAETGTLVVVENEGNGRLCSSLPPVFIAVMGIEKVIPKLSDLSHFLEILPRAAAGQKLTTYTVFLKGPRARHALDGPREMHVVILDNGRRAMRADAAMREALYCVRCGACLNVCPVYRRIGGHAYGSPYPGPIGSVVSPYLVGSATGHLAFASTLCGACREICPVHIDLPRLLLEVRWKQSEGGAPLAWPLAQKRARLWARALARLFNHPGAARLLGRLGAAMLRPFASEGYIRRIPGPLNGWTRVRDLKQPHPAAARAVKPSSDDFFEHPGEKLDEPKGEVSQDGAALPAVPPAADEAAPARGAPAADRSELSATFAREVKRLGAELFEVASAEEAGARILELARLLKAHSVAIGGSVVTDLSLARSALEREGLQVFQTAQVEDEPSRAAARERIAQADLAVTEAHYAIAASGTLAVVTQAERPWALTLLAPASAVIVHIDRVLPSLAAVLDALGSKAVATDAMTLITGPSRSADIEKRIVLGVHGPKSLYVILLRPREV